MEPLSSSTPTAEPHAHGFCEVLDAKENILIYPCMLNLFGWYEMELPCLKIFIYFYYYYLGLKVIYKSP